MLHKLLHLNYLFQEKCAISILSQNGSKINRFEYGLKINALYLFYALNQVSDPEAMEAMKSRIFQLQRWKSSVIVYP